MTSRNFLKPKNFKIKAVSKKFESVEFMTDLEKSKIYVSFVKLLNNHFKRTLFKKNLYQHFMTHCGFIAHYNIHGFYGEYFETAAKFHFNVNNYSNPMHECGGILNEKSMLSHGEQFYAIYEEINASRNGLGEFYDSIMSNQNWGAYSDYRDLDDAIKEAFSEYMEIWRGEIKKAVQAYNRFTEDERIQELKAKKEELVNEQIRLSESLDEIEETLIIEANTTILKEEAVKSGIQLSLFDFAS